eukprot:TRINITY_DN9906_c0_g4_i1.p1 TRINITY_DN9906_c0_g4~~TRINITY_DN9906_c0_g4_i1.p1  ORF type:complete len:520 (+),score=24.62 TRINITY_DN9906_c0_g4_i1:186-1562(+)
MVDMMRRRSNGTREMREDALIKDHIIKDGEQAIFSKEVHRLHDACVHHVNGWPAKESPFHELTVRALTVRAALSGGFLELRQHLLTRSNTPFTDLVSSLLRPKFINFVVLPLIKKGDLEGQVDLLRKIVLAEDEDKVGAVQSFFENFAQSINVVDQDGEVSPDDKRLEFDPPLKVKVDEHAEGHVVFTGFRVKEGDVDPVMNFFKAAQHFIQEKCQSVAEPHTQGDRRIAEHVASSITDDPQTRKDIVQHIENEMGQSWFTQVLHGNAAYYSVSAADDVAEGGAAAKEVEEEANFPKLAIDDAKKERQESEKKMFDGLEEKARRLQKHANNDDEEYKTLLDVFADESLVALAIVFKHPKTNKAFRYVLGELTQKLNDGTALVVKGSHSKRTSGLSSAIQSAAKPAKGWLLPPQQVNMWMCDMTLRATSALQTQEAVDPFTIAFIICVCIRCCCCPPKC